MIKWEYIIWLQARFTSNQSSFMYVISKNCTLNKISSQRKAP